MKRPFFWVPLGWQWIHTCGGSLYKSEFELFLSSLTYNREVMWLSPQKHFPSLFSLPSPLQWVCTVALSFLNFPITHRSFPNLPSPMALMTWDSHFKHTLISLKTNISDAYSDHDFAPQVVCLGCVFPKLYRGVVLLPLCTIWQKRVQLSNRITLTGITKLTRIMNGHL